MGLWPWGALGPTRPPPGARPPADIRARIPAFSPTCQAGWELDRMTFAVFPAPPPGRAGAGPGRGSGPVGLGPWGALGPTRPPMAVTSAIGLLFGAVV